MRRAELVQGSRVKVQGKRRRTSLNLEPPRPANHTSLGRGGRTLNWAVTRSLTLILLLLSTPIVAQAADYCSQLEAMGLEGKYVAVTSSLGNAAETREGKLVAIEPGTLILNPAPGPDVMQPLYEGSKIVEPMKTRVYLNCEHIVSVTVDPIPLTR